MDLFQTPNIEDDVDLHFIAFVEKDGELYELDGAKPFPINHGPIDENMLLEVSLIFYFNLRYIERSVHLYETA